MELMNDREVQIATEMRRCRFFNGIQNETCAAGVNYRQLVGGEDLGWALGIPCVGDMKPDGTRIFSHSNRQVVPCEKRKTPSREEAEHDVDESNVRTADVLRRIEAGEDVPGVIVCGKRTQPEGKECPRSEDGKCPQCGAPVEGIYGLGSGYGGIGSYAYCTNEECGEVCDLVEDSVD